MNWWPFPKKPAASDKATAGGVAQKDGAPFPFNKIMPYDATGGEKLYRAYQQSAWVQRAIKKISGPIAAVSLNFTLTGEPFEDPSIDAFWQQPAVRMSKHDFLEATVGWLKLEGECFWLMDDTSLVPFPEVQGGKSLTPLIVARPDRMFLHRSGQAILGWDYVDGDGRHHGLLPRQVIHIRAWNPYDEFRGLSEMSAAKDAAEADFFAGKYAKNQFANNGDRGPYVIAKNGVPDDNQRQMIVDQLREKRELAQRGVYKPIFLAGDISIEDPKVQAPDATFISARLENRHEVALAFGVPPSMFDVKASYSIGSASDYYMLVAETCIPTGKKLEHGISRVVNCQTGKPVEAVFNWDEHPVIQAVRRERIDSAAKLWAMGSPLKQINDYLDLRLPEMDGWDIGYIPATLVPVGTPPPEQNPDYAEAVPETDESKLEKMKRVLNMRETMRRVFINAPSEDCCLRRMQSAGVTVKVANAREMALWRQLQLERAATRNAYISKIGKCLMEARAEVKARIDRHGVKSAAVRAVAADFMFDVAKFGEKLFAAIRPVTQQALDQAGADLFKSLGIEDPWKFPPHEATNFLRDRENHLSGVPDEIGRAILDTLNQGLHNGDSIAQMQSAVSAKFNQVSKGRAKTIAITETGMAYETSRDKAMLAGGIKFKRWLTSGNPNVRPAHEEAEGQTVAVTASFVVGGESLRFPCDPEGSAGNIINCHCVSIPSADGPKESEKS